MDESKYIHVFATGRITINTFLRLAEELMEAGQWDDPSQEIHVAFGNNTFVLGVEKR